MSLQAASLEVHVAPKFSGAPLELNVVNYRTSNEEQFSVTRCSFILDGFALQRADGSWLELTNEIAWFDAEQNRLSHSMDAIAPDQYQAFRFYLGPDAEQNHADIAQFPADNPLNPNMNNLHWSWQGGFIFLALEGMWQERRAPSRPEVKDKPQLAEAVLGAPSGWAYHLARDTNRTCITLAAPFDLTRDTRLELDFDLATLLNAPRPLSFSKDGSSTHSREGDPIAAALVANLPGAFHVSRVQRVDADSAPIAMVKPLYLPAQFTPYPFQMSATFPIPDLPRDNPLTKERVTLGEKLFHEPLLSKDNTLSCASCHDEKHAFADPRKFSVGVREQVGTRNAMPLFNLAWRSAFFWDGRAPSLRAQALMPIEDHTEMDESLTNVVAKLGGTGLWPVVSGVPPETVVASTPATRATAQLKSPVTPPSGGTPAGTGETPVPPNYPALFTAAFGSPEITPEKIGLAIEAFLLTLTSFDSKFDRALAGTEQLTTEEQRGLELFMTEYDPRRQQFGADCFHCHGGPLFQSQTFANNGLDATFKDPGRAKVTGKDSDQGKFATPSLRNIALTAPYMHDGRFATLEEVVRHYSTGQQRSATLDPNLAKHMDGGVQLNTQDQEALVAFLKALTDEKYLQPSNH